MAIPLIGGIVEAGLEIINKVIPDPAARDAARLKLIELQQAGGLKELDASMQVIIAEAQSEHPLTAQWRPITMLTFVAIVANNYLIYPYLSLFWDQAPVLPLPTDLWDLIKIGLGGYVVGRSGEKIAKVMNG